MSRIFIKYGDFVFNSTSGYPIPNVSFGVNHNRTSAGDYLSSEQTVTLEGVCYTLLMTEQDNTTSYNELNENQKSDSFADLVFRATNLQKEMIANNNRQLFIGLEIGDEQYQPFISGNALLENIVFSENANNWTTTIDYNIEFKIPVSNTGSNLLAIDNESYDNYVTSVTDNYSLEPMNDSQRLYRGETTYKLTRNIGAVGSRVLPESGALYHAKKWVIDRANYWPTTGIFIPEYFTLYNQERSVNLSEAEGSYSITDSFVAKSGDPWLDTYNISIDVDENFKRTIKIDGTIQGLTPATGVYGTGFIQVLTEDRGFNDNFVLFPSGQHDIQPTITGFDQNFSYTGDDYLVTLPHTQQKVYRTKYANAVSGYRNISNTTFTRAYQYDVVNQNLISDDFHGKVNFSNYKTKPLNTIPLSVTEAFYPFEGKITYSRSYDTRYSATISGAIAENFSIDDKIPTVRTEEIQVLGRRLGPVVYEYYGSTTIGSRTVNYEGYFPRETGSMKKYQFPKQIIHDIDHTLKLYQPMPPYTGFITQDTQDFDMSNNKISRVITWEYTRCQG